MQSKKHSFLEVTASTLTGYVIAIGTQYIVFPIYGIPVNFNSHLQIAAIFTIISIGRSYIFRRAANWLRHRR